MKVDQRTFNVLKAYERIFESADGQLVLTDLSRAYQFRMNEDLNEELEAIPHPFRMYFLAGGTDVVNRIVSTVNTAKEAEYDDGG